MGHQTSTLSIQPQRRAPASLPPHRLRSGHARRLKAVPPSVAAELSPGPVPGRPCERTTPCGSPTARPRSSGPAAARRRQGSDAPAAPRSGTVTRTPKGREAPTQAVPAPGRDSRSHFVLPVEDGRHDVRHLAVARRPGHAVQRLAERREGGVHVEPQRLLDDADAQQIAGPAGGSHGSAPTPAAHVHHARPPDAPHYRLNTLPVFCMRFPAMAAA